MVDSKNTYQEFLNKTVTIFYNDIPTHVTASEGVLIFIDDKKLVLQTVDKQILIPVDKIIRTEVKNCPNCAKELKK